MEAVPVVAPTAAPGGGGGGGGFFHSSVAHTVGLVAQLRVPLPGSKVDVCQRKPSQRSQSTGGGGGGGRIAVCAF